MSTTPPLQSQTGVSTPALAAVYHSWFMGHAEAAGERPPKGEDESSSQDLADIQEGKSPLPPSSHCIFDVEPLPHGCPREWYWPTWEFSFFNMDSGELVASGSLSNEGPVMTGYVGIQAPETPDSVWNKSSGYRLICYFEPLSFAARIEIKARLGSAVSGTKVIPWQSPA